MLWQRQGFTLIELSIVLLILSLIGGGLLAALTQNTRLTQQKELQSKLDAIESGLIRYRRQYNRLPCPADGSLTVSDRYFGIEAANSGVCDGNPSANFNDSANTSEGVIPVRTLGLPDDFIFDPWGGRFSYAVDIRMTAPSAFMNHAMDDLTIGSITLVDSNELEITDRAIAVVLSHGANGHGAFQLSGLRKSSGSENANELLNCHCNSEASPVDYTSRYVIQPSSGANANSTQSYDDIVNYWVRSQIYSANDLGMR